MFSPGTLSISTQVLQTSALVSGGTMSIAASAAWPIRDLGDVMKKSESGSAPALMLAVTLPVCASGAAAIIAADSLKAPTTIARVLLGATLGAAVAGTSTTGLSGGRLPSLALLSLLLGAVVGSLGAFSLAATPAAHDAAKDAARQQRREERALAAAKAGGAGSTSSTALAAAPASSLPNDAGDAQR